MAVPDSTVAGGAIESARAWIAAKALILDTETTGLGADAEVVELAVIDCTGAVLLDTLVRPSGRVPVEATAIHGITDAMLVDAPPWSEIHDQFYRLIAGRQVVAYNAEFDVRLLEQTARRYVGNEPGLEFVPLDQVAAFSCAMQAYAEFYGEWSNEKGRYRWQNLVNAAQQQSVMVENAHRALGDCLMTLGIIRAMSCQIMTKEYDNRVLIRSK